MKTPKKVIVSFTFKVQTDSGESLSELFNTGKGYVDIGGFEIMKNGNAIPFDFESASWRELQHPFYEFSNYYGFICHDVDPCHSEEWEAIGLTKKDITAELLASADDISDFYFSLHDKDKNIIAHTFEIVSMAFGDENGDTYFIGEDVLQRYNESLKERKAMKKWRIPVTWEMHGTVTVDADTLNEAMEKVLTDDSIPLPDGNYVDGSFDLSTEDEEFIRQYFNNGETDDDSVSESLDESDDKYIRSATANDYSPSCPWSAPGMSIKDFI